jgi:hypothetical protein
VGTFVVFFLLGVAERPNLIALHALGLKRAHVLIVIGGSDLSGVHK